jgi:hypothetical protein
MFGFPPPLSNARGGCEMRLLTPLLVSLIVPFLLPPVTGSPFLLVTVGLTHVSEFSFYLGTEVQ